MTVQWMNIRTVLPSEQIAELYRIIFNELKEKKEQLPSQCFREEKKNNKRYENLWF